MQPAIGQIIDRYTRKFLGTAFAVSMTHAFTAFHCIGNRMTGEILKPQVLLKFLDDTEIVASFEAGSSKEDYAVLLLDTLLPESLKPIPLLDEAIPNETFRAAGYPVAVHLSGSQELPDISYIGGLIRAENSSILGGSSAIQLFSDESAAGLSLHGMSGGPVLVGQKLEGAVGLLRWNVPHPDKPDLGVGGNIWACPTKLILENNPQYQDQIHIERRAGSGHTIEQSTHDIETIQPYLGRLKRMLERQELLLLVGTELPSSLSGIPSQTELTKALQVEFQLDSCNTFQQCASLVDRFSLIKFLRSVLKYEPSTALYSQIATIIDKFNIDTVVTTALDDNLRQALSKKGRLNWIASDSHLQLAQRSSRNLIHLYGHIDNPDTLILTDKDQRETQRRLNKSLMMDRITTELQQRGLLAVGFRLTDPAFLDLLDSLSAREFQAPSFAVSPNASLAAKEAMLRTYKLTVIPAEIAEVFGQLVGS